MIPLQKGIIRRDVVIPFFGEDVVVKKCKCIGDTIESIDPSSSNRYLEIYGKRFDEQLFYKQKDSLLIGHEYIE
jgi:hypothetical protein